MLYTLWVGFLVLFYKGKEKKSKWKKKKQRYDSCVENFLIRTHQHGTVPQEITEPAPVAFAAFSVNPQICWIHIYCSFNSDDETAVHTGGHPLYATWVCAAPKGMVFVPFRYENGYGVCSCLVWNWVWFSRKLRKCMNVFIVSIPNEPESKSNMRIRNGF